MFVDLNSEMNSAETCIATFLTSFDSAGHDIIIYLTSVAVQYHLADDVLSDNNHIYPRFVPFIPGIEPATATTNTHVAINKVHDSIRSWPFDHGCVCHVLCALIYIIL